MNKKITTYNDFLEEKERIKNLHALHKQHVSQHWTEFKEGLTPVGNAFSAIGKMAHRDKSNPLVNMGLNVAGDLLLKRVLLAKAGWFTKLAVPFVVKNYSSHLLAAKGRGLLHRVLDIFRKKPAPRHMSSATYDQGGYRSASDPGYQRPAMSTEMNGTERVSSPHIELNPGQSTNQEPTRS
jgi:hypothetical protein